MTLTTPAPLPVLVVDDDAGVRGLLTTGLRRIGLEVVEAETGPAALAILDAHMVSVVVCDVGLPGMSGIEVVRAIRKRPETATLPIILVTGFADDRSLVDGLEAGADDFLAKPVRLEEFIARVRAHLRTQAAWSDVLQSELAVRSGVVAALGSLTLFSEPEETAEAVVREIADRTGSVFVSVAQVTFEGRMQELATFNPEDGLHRGGDPFSADLASYLLGRARGGPWVDEVRAIGPAEPTASLRKANLDIVASAPIFSRDDLVGLLSIGAVADASRSARSRQARLLAAAIDYASVLSAVAGSSFAGRRDAGGTRARLRAILDDGAFHPVFQPIVELDGLATVGFEALTRFDDGVAPGIRFAEAAEAGLGPDFELAAIRLAIGQSAGLPADAFVTVNISPRSLIDRADEVRSILRTVDRTIVVELTEHIMIDDYTELRGVLDGLGDRAEVAVDDAGAGFASMRHILELQPAFAKLDMSLVRGIDADDLRQALAAGLNYFSVRTGCRLIAEGIETQPEAETLTRLGIELGQGYLFGRPARIGEPGRS